MVEVFCIVMLVLVFITYESKINQRDKIIDTHLQEYWVEEPTYTLGVAGPAGTRLVKMYRAKAGAA